MTKLLIPEQMSFRRWLALPRIPAGIFAIPGLAYLPSKALQINRLFGAISFPYILRSCARSIHSFVGKPNYKNSARKHATAVAVGETFNALQVDYAPHRGELQTVRHYVKV